MGYDRSRFGWDAFDLHVHTAETSRCASLTGAEQAEIYYGLGYCGIVIADHYFSGFFGQFAADTPWSARVDEYLKGYRAAKAVGDRLGLKVFLGAEMRFPQGFEDYLFTGYDEQFLYENPELYKLDLESFSQIVRKNGWFLAQAHPARPGIRPQNGAFLDAGELFNGHPGHAHDDAKAHAWIDGYGLLPISGSDAHDAGMPGRSGMLFEPGVNTVNDLIARIKSGRYGLIHPSDPSGI